MLSDIIALRQVSMWSDIDFSIRIHMICSVDEIRELARMVMSFTPITMCYYVKPVNDTVHISLVSGTASD